MLLGWMRTHSSFKGLDVLGGIHWTGLGPSHSLTRGGKGLIGKPQRNCTCSRRCDSPKEICHNDSLTKKNRYLAKKKKKKRKEDCVSLFTPIVWLPQFSLWIKTEPTSWGELIPYAIRPSPASVFYPPLRLALHVMVSGAAGCENGEASAGSAGDPAPRVTEMPKGMCPCH